MAIGSAMKTVGLVVTRYVRFKLFFLVADATILKILCSFKIVSIVYALCFQVNFSYVEAGEQKQALVKLVACKRLATPYYTCVKPVFIHY